MSMEGGIASLDEMYKRVAEVGCNIKCDKQGTEQVSNIQDVYKDKDIFMVLFRITRSKIMLNGSKGVKVVFKILVANLRVTKKKGFISEL